jgi:UDP-2,4-diacetamido-2,4,6-trideoxy-beta-L-altropyranose hydrolase
VNILFRVDSSSKIGLGHVMRCLVLAKQYKEDNVVFATQDLKGNANQKIIDESYKLIALNDGSVDELIQRINELNVDMVVFDHYGINDDFEKAVKDLSGVKILSFDDVYEKHYCDILLNHNIYADAGKYKGLVPDFCKIRCGEKYTLVRDEFKKIEIKKNLSNKGKLVVFVCLGGADANNISLPVLEILSDFDNIIVNLATTSSNKNIDQLLGFSKQYEDINICIDCNVAELMSNSNFSIITPSVIVHEVMIVKLPFIALLTADNQEMMYQYLCENNYPVFRQDELNELRMEIKNYV